MGNIRKLFYLTIAYVTFSQFHHIAAFPGSGSNANSDVKTSSSSSSPNNQTLFMG